MPTRRRTFANVLNIISGTLTGVTRTPRARYREDDPMTAGQASSSARRSLVGSIRFGRFGGWIKSLKMLASPRRFFSSRTNQLDSVLQLEAMDTRTPDPKNAQDLLEQSKNDKIPLYLKKLVGKKTLRIIIANDACELLANMQSIYTKIEKMKLPELKKSVADNLSIFRNSNASDAKNYIEQFGIKDKKNNVSIVGLVGCYFQLKDISNFVQKNSILKRFIEVVGQPTQIDDVSSDIPRCIMFLELNSQSNSDSDLNICTIITSLMNRYKDLYSFSQRAKDDSYNNYYSMNDAVSQKERPHMTIFTLFKEKNFRQRIENDVFRWSMVIDYNLPECKKIIKQLCIAHESTKLTNY